METPSTPPQTPPELKWVESLTRLLDDSFRIPVLGFRFGLDPVIGLIPGIGDAISFAISSLMVLTMVRHGAGMSLALRMIWNIVIDALIGEIPIIGDLFDFAKKANKRNLTLMQKHYANGKAEGKGGWGAVLLVLIIIMIIFAALLFLMWKVAAYFAEILGSSFQAGSF